MSASGDDGAGSGRKGLDHLDPPGLVDLGEPAAVELGPGAVAGRPGQRLFVVLRAPGCGHARRTGGCTNCGFLALSTGGAPVPVERLLEQMRRALDRFEAPTRRQVVELDIFCSGSFLADDEVPAAARRPLLELAVAALPALQAVVIETRPELVSAAALAPLVGALSSWTGDSGRPGPVLEVAIGLESANDVVRLERVRKGFTLQCFEEAARCLAAAGADLIAYLLLKPLDTAEEEAVADVLATGHYLVALSQRLGLPVRVALEPTFVVGGTALHEAFVAGRFRPPSLWSVVRATRGLAELLPVRVGLSSEGLPVGAVPEGCPRCTGLLRQALARFNETQDIALLDGLSCGCTAL